MQVVGLEKSLDGLYNRVIDQRNGETRKKRSRSTMKNTSSRIPTLDDLYREIAASQIDGDSLTCR